MFAKIVVTTRNRDLDNMLLDVYAIFVLLKNKILYD